MKTKWHLGVTSDFKTVKPLAHHGVGRERRRLIVDEGFPYSHSHTEWPSIVTLSERAAQAPTQEIFPVPHHALPATEDMLNLIFYCATQLASTPVLFGMMKALHENLPTRSVDPEYTEERLRGLSGRVDLVEQRLARLEVLASPRSDEPETGDPFEAFQDLRRALGEERFRWITSDE